MNLKLTYFFLLFTFFGGLIHSQTFDPSQIKGTWRGTWFNLTFFTTDSAFLNVDYDAGMSTISMVLDLEGSVFGGSNPDPATLNGTYDQNGFYLTGNSSTYGDMFFSAFLGIFVGRLPAVPNPGIDSTVITGAFDDTDIGLNYTVYFTGGSDSAIGVISMKKDQTTDVNPIESNPAYYGLYQNYPNPFNPVTNIQFTIKEKEFVSLVVYDALGNRVATLINEGKHAGNYNIKFNASSLPSGIYFYHLQTTTINQTKKMILMKQVKESTLF